MKVLPIIQYEEVKVYAMETTVDALNAAAEVRRLVGAKMDVVHSPIVVNGFNLFVACDVQALVQLGVGISSSPKEELALEGSRVMVSTPAFTLVINPTVEVPNNPIETFLDNAVLYLAITPGVVLITTFSELLGNAKLRLRYSEMAEASKENLMLKKAYNEAINNLIDLDWSVMKRTPWHDAIKEHLEAMTDTVIEGILEETKVTNVITEDMVTVLTDTYAAAQVFLTIKHPTR